MVRRYDGFLRPMARGRWPERICIVECASYRGRLVPGRRCLHERLHSWHMIILSRRDGIYKVAAEVTGRGRQGFWSQIEELLIRPRSVWVVSTNCNRVWPLLGVWQEMERGRLEMVQRIVAGDEIELPEVSDMPNGVNAPQGQYATDQVSMVRDTQCGFVVTSSTVNLLKCRRTGCAGTLRWYDARNWGLGDQEPARHGRARARDVAEQLLDIAGALEAHDLGALRPTVASTALASWLYCGYTHGVYAHDHEEILQLETEAYYGGRAECFWHGTVPEPVWHYDYRSMYPYVCIHTDLPVAVVSYRGLGAMARLSAPDDPRSALACVDLHSEEPAYPIRVDGALVFPVGTYTTVLAGPSLADAVAHGRVVAWHEWVEYQMAPALATWMRKVYDLRCQADQDGKSALAGWWKRLMVSLCGRLAQRDHSWELCPGVWSDLLYGQWLGSDNAGRPCDYVALAGIVHRETEHGYSANTAPALSAWITSAGRMRLLEAIRMAGWENVYYVDTDSLFVSMAGHLRLQAGGAVASGQLGRLELRGEGIRLELYGPKYYREDSKLVCAGMPHSARRLSEDSPQYFRSQGVREALQREERPEAIELIRNYARNDNDLAEGRIVPLVLRGLHTGGARDGMAQA